MKKKRNPAKIAAFSKRQPAQSPGPTGQELSRAGGDDALASSSPPDARSDEKVIVNGQRSEKTVNAPSQTAANTSEAAASDEEIF